MSLCHACYAILGLLLFQERRQETMQEKETKRLLHIVILSFKSKYSTLPCVRFAPFQLHLEA